MTFDRLEILIALGAGSRKEENWLGYWAPPGCFGYRHQNRERILSEIRSSLDGNGNGSAYVKSRIFGTTAEQCKSEIEKLTDFLSKLNLY